MTAEGEPRAGAAIYSIARRELTGDRTPAFVLDAPLPVRQVIEEDGVLYIQDGTSFFAAIDAESGTLISRYDLWDGSMSTYRMFAVRDGVVEALRWLRGRGHVVSDTLVEVAHINREFVSCGPAPSSDATQWPRDRLVAIDAETMTVLDLPLLTNGLASALDVSPTRVLQNTSSWWSSPNFTLYRR